MNYTNTIPNSNSETNFIIPLFMAFFAYISLYIKSNPTEIDNINKKIHKKIHKFLMYLTPSIYHDEFDNNEDNFIEDLDEDKDLNKNIDVKKKEINYEDKYLDKIKSMNKEYFFSEEEKEEEEEKFIYLVLKSIETEKLNLENEMTEIKNKLFVLYEDTNENNENNDEHDYNFIDKDQDLHPQDLKNKELVLKEELNNLQQKIDHINTENTININELRVEAINCVINKKLDNLKNCLIIEKTPLGNVLMFYNNVKESFEYYSDNIIPYRFLETVARKYVINYNCLQIYVDMKEEITEYIKKEDEKRKEKEEREEKKREEDELNSTKKTEIKKNVFAKFKDYNKEGGSGKVNMAPLPKNNIPNKNVKNQNEKLVLKEKTNRYTYSGKFANYNFLKKVDRKVVDKKYAMTFADFKKSMLKEKS